MIWRRIRCRIQADPPCVISMFDTNPQRFRTDPKTDPGGSAMRDFLVCVPPCGGSNKKHVVFEHRLGSPLSFWCTQKCSETCPRRRVAPNVHIGNLHACVRPNLSKGVPKLVPRFAPKCGPKCAPRFGRKMCNLRPHCCAEAGYTFCAQIGAHTWGKIWEQIGVHV